MNDQNHPKAGDDPRIDLNHSEVDTHRRVMLRGAILSLGLTPWMTSSCGGGGSTGAETAQGTAAPNGVMAPSAPEAPAAPTPTPPAPSSPPPPPPPTPPAPPPPAPLPTWVPPAGQVALLTQANGGLTNRFIDVVAPYFEPFYSVKVVNDYSGAFKNPYWGTYGCTVFFGGGHAATNDNMVAIAEYGRTAITFKRVCDPTPWFGTGTDAQTKRDNSLRNANEHLDIRYMESRIDGKPGAPHSYGSGDIVGPEYGGAAHGTFLRVLSAAVNAANGEGAVAAHQLRFDDMLTPSHVRTWSRLTNEYLAPRSNWLPPHLTCFVGPQQRVYIQTNDQTAQPRWFDCVRKTWVSGTGRGFGYDQADGFDSGILFYVPSRDLLVCMYPRGEKLVVQWMLVNTDQPTLGGTASLSTALPVADPWSAACWCPHNNRIVLIGVTADKTAAYEIEIPPEPNQPWTVTRAPFGPAQSLAPADPEYRNGITFKKFHYDERVRAIVYMPVASATGEDQVWVYRPRFT